MNFRAPIVLGLLVFSAFATVLGQTKPQADSAYKVIQQMPDDTAKVRGLSHLGLEVRLFDLNWALEISQEGYDLADELDDLTGKEMCLKTIAIVKATQGELVDALEIFEQTLEINVIRNDPEDIATSLNNIGLVQYYMGNYALALDHYFKALKIYDAMESATEKASTLNNIGLIYEEEEQFEEAIEYYTKAYDTRKAEGNKRQMGFGLANIGNTYFLMKKGDQALENYLQASALFQEINDQQSIALLDAHIGRTYWDRKDFDEALKYYQHGLDIQNEIGDKYGATITIRSIGEVYRDQGKPEEALAAFRKSLDMATESKAKAQVKDAAVALANLFAELSDYENAYIYQELSADVKDSILNEKNNDMIAELKAQHQSEQQEKEIAIQKAENERQRLVNWALGLGVLLLLALAVVVLRSYKQKKTAFDLLDHKNKEITLQAKIIEERNQDITSSIKYAKQIQDAMLPPEKWLNEQLEEYFIFFEPKDIVSGDFYWMHEVDQKLILAAVDCTGHGVPGAFMSIVGHNHLTQAVVEKKLIRPSEILDFLNKEITKTLRQKDEDNAVQDGMDLALCVLDKATGNLEYAGANNPLYLIKEGKLEEVKPDKQSIGSFHMHDKAAFTNHSLQLKKGDAFYLFSDGYADQFGGPRGKKFNYKTFKALLTDNAALPMGTQKEILSKNLRSWMGELEQLDDICVIGVRV